MHFRFRGKNVQIVRSGKDAATGKAKSTPIGSINRDTLRITDTLRSQCSEQELEEIEAWVRHYNTTASLKREFAAATLAEQMATAATWFENTPPSAQDAVLADDIAQAWATLRKTLVNKS